MQVSSAMIWVLLKGGGNNLALQAVGAVIQSREFNPFLTQWVSAETHVPLPLKVQNILAEIPAIAIETVLERRH